MCGAALPGVADGTGVGVGVGVLDVETLFPLDPGAVLLPFAPGVVSLPFAPGAVLLPFAPGVMSLPFAPAKACIPPQVRASKAAPASMLGYFIFMVQRVSASARSADVSAFHTPGNAFHPIHSRGGGG